MSGKKRQTPGDEPKFKQYLCRVCQKDRGVATSTAIEVYSHILVNVKTGKVARRKALKRLVCAYCFTKDKLTVIE